MKKSFILILLILAIASISVTANGNGITGVAVSDYDSTIISGIYIPYQGNESLIPEGANVNITCNNTTISTNDTVIDSMGYYSKVVPSSECAVGDQVQSCVVGLYGIECSALVTVDAIGNTGWGSGLAHIIGVPEYTTAAVAFLMLFTGGGIAYLRNKKR